MSPPMRSARGACTYGSECAYLEDCACGCCLVIHGCECDEEDFCAGDEHLDENPDEDA